MQTGSTDNSCKPFQHTGLILTGGGARAAYQVGVLSALFEILGLNQSTAVHNTPFSIICGSSAGAINAASLASNAHNPHKGIHRLEELWGSLRTEMVYAADALSLFKTGAHWLSVLSLGWLIKHLRNNVPYSLLNNEPLRALLKETIDFDRISGNINSGCLAALAITATEYNTGEHLTFYNSNITIKPWKRSSRKAVAGTICLDHLMASSAIPFIFPAEPLLVRGKTHWCGDGSMRQLAPISPAIHLGARRIVVIGTAFNGETHPNAIHNAPDYPSLAQIGGHMLSNIFIDSLAMDIERMNRINDLLAKLPPDGLKSQSLHPVQTLIITPSQSLDEVALRHVNGLPRSVRTLFRALGVSPKSESTMGSALVSYLLFESSYTQELIQLGRADCMRRTTEVKEFFRESF